jgi:two-component system, OmpR family, KDP operon response regulator KdpE
MSNDTPTILVVDDEKMTSRTMTMALEAAGYQTEVADTGKGALESAVTNHPDLILLDYNMPDMNGVTALRQLRTDEWGKSVPVIIASNVYDVDIINAIIELGVQDYVLKVDVNLDEIVKLVGKYVPAPLTSEQ